MNVLLSIKPKFANKILVGEKKYEFRKSKINPKKNVNKIFIYSSSPVKKIVGSFRIEKVFEDTPSNLWDRFNEFGSIEKKDFFEYYKQKEMGCAFKIKDLEVFENQIDPKEIFEKFVAPQNYRYLNDEETSKIQNDSISPKISDYHTASLSSDKQISRLLSESEIDELDRLLLPHLSKKYPNFESWLQKAKDGIKEGSRIAFGEWAYGKLISTIILKPTVSGNVELKSLFVDPDFQGAGRGPQIYEIAEKQCLKMNFKKIVVDTFCQDNDIVHFLISSGYKIYGKEDLYGNGNESYLFSKTLKPQYVGDPYDWEAITEWLIENHFGFEIEENHPIIDKRALDFSIKKKINSKFEIKGLIEVKDTLVDQDPVSMLYQKTIDGGYHVPIFIGRKFKSRATDFAKSKGVILIDEKGITEISGHKPPEVTKKDIRGILLPIKPEFYQKIVLQGLKNFVYFKGAPFGKSLKQGDSIVFYVESPRKEISAYGIIKSTSIDKPEIQWESYGKRSVFDEKDFFRFANSKREILAIEIKSFTEIKPIGHKDIIQRIPAKLLSGAYIDKETLDKLI
ncbi:GNAT family N-acetyltransferase [Methanococcoides orientis]|uniref:GNAT family N-acetyltransferase n=1 Tax=Methanococcoides orientis TaxID=2822137 RepID=UPI001E5FD5F4|nr:GNAT family N-acetyltransferase [Methanococcoides orientis]UGV39970.1 GNAT family N-acetyltransferase [Methanococcoides orientis]